MLSFIAQTRRRPSTRGRRLVDAGRVFCPRAQADIDVENCLLCPWLKQAELTEAGGWLRCAPPSALSMPPFSSMLTTGRERR